MTCSPASSTRRIARVSVATRLETISVLCSPRIEASAEQASAFFDSFRLEEVPVTVAQIEAAIDGLMRYGKGRHPAALNFGDCFTYGLVKVLDAQLLFKGDDFALTDLTPVWRPVA